MTFKYLFVASLFMGSFEPLLAHGSIENMGSFYNGLLHPFFTLHHLLLLSAFGLLLGQIDNNLRLGFFTLTIASILGLMGSSYCCIELMQEKTILSIAIVTSLIVAFKIPINNSILFTLAFFIGIIVSLDSAQETLQGSQKLIALFGTEIGIATIVLFALAFSEYFTKKEWQKIVVRVIASWISSSSILVLALLFSKN